MGDLSSAVAEVTRSASAQDRGVVALALTYAEEIESGGDLGRLGPPLLAALEALQLSPRARKAVKLDDKPAGNPLDQLADRRRSRAG